VEGITTTLGRGGSDYSAAILGAALGAEEIQIWTDVDGIMTCDPRVVPDARLIDSMSFREAAELAYFGARVLHPSTILPAVQKGIPVRVLNSKHPEVRGTTILKQTDETSPPAVKALAFKEHITLINIDSTRMLMMHGFLARVFEVFAKYRKSVDVIATSEVSISLTVDDDRDLQEIVRELSSIAEVEFSHGKAICCIVGEGLKSSERMLSRVFSVLERHQIPVSMISLGASEINITFVVDEEHARKAALALHDEFFSEN
jgi:aspartate kinase